jgi:hypothetical protein
MHGAIVDSPELAKKITAGIDRNWLILFSAESSVFR